MLCVRTKLFVVVLKLSSMGGSDSPPPTIIIEDDVEQDADSQNDIPKSFKIQIDLLAAIIGLIMFITGAGLYASDDNSGFEWLIYGILVLLLSGILWAIKTLFFEKRVSVVVTSDENEMDNSSEPEFISEMSRFLFWIGLGSIILGGGNEYLNPSLILPKDDFFVPVCMGIFLMIFSGVLKKYGNHDSTIKALLSVTASVVAIVVDLFYLLDGRLI